MRGQTEVTPILEEKKASHTCHVTSALAHRLELEHHEACAKTDQASMRLRFKAFTQRELRPKTREATDPE
jgi:hypothetical protein